MWKKYIKREMDVEFFACVHGMSLVFVYGFELYLCGIKNLSFAVIFQLFVLGYFISWFQKLLFFKEKIYAGLEKGIRITLWCAGPGFLTWLFSIGCERYFHTKWYEGAAGWVEPVFYLIMLLYYIMLWIALQLMYRDESVELTAMLSDYKKKQGKGGESWESLQRQD